MRWLVFITILNCCSESCLAMEKYYTGHSYHEFLRKSQKEIAANHFLRSKSPTNQPSTIRSRKKSNSHKSNDILLALLNAAVEKIPNYQSRTLETLESTDEKLFNKIKKELIGSYASKVIVRVLDRKNGQKGIFKSPTSIQPMPFKNDFAYVIEIDTEWYEKNKSKEGILNYALRFILLLIPAKDAHFNKYRNEYRKNKNNLSSKSVSDILNNLLLNGYKTDFTREEIIKATLFAATSGNCIDSGISMLEDLQEQANPKKTAHASITSCLETLWQRKEALGDSALRNKTSLPGTIPVPATNPFKCSPPPRTSNQYGTSY